MSDQTKRRVRTMNSATLTAAIRDFGTAKEIARTAGCSEATAARYRRGETTPDAVRLARLMGHSHQIAAALLRMAGLDDLTMDLEEARLVGELRRLREKRGAHGSTADAAFRAVARERLGGTGVDR